METTQKTKTMYFEELKDMVEQVVDDVDYKADMLQFLDNRIMEQDKRREAARARAEKKKAVTEVLTAEIYALIGNTPKTADEIVVALDREDVTRNKVISRLGKLVKAGQVDKDFVKVDGKKRMAYFLPTE
jgi:hypothetical protein